MEKNNNDRMLVCGNVDGNFESLLSRLEQLAIKFTGKSKFESLFVSGEFFGSNLDENNKMLSGHYIVNIPIYILGPLNPERTKYYTVPAGENLGNNVIYLGRKGVFTTASGLKIVYLSGKEGEYADDCHFSTDSINDLIAQVTSVPDFRGVDILLTSQWPSGVDKLTSHTPDVANDEQLRVSSLVSRLAAALKPRYHFAAMADCHYERPPYRNYKILQESSSLYPSTRFVGLAKCGNPSRCKWLYAFHVTPMCHMKSMQSDHPTCTEFPYGETLRELELRESERRAVKAEKRASEAQFFYDMNAANDDDNQQSKKRGKRGKTTFGEGEQQSQPCWFCLSSPEVEKHLVVSVGEHVYLALAKGPLTPDHILIMPINHVQSLAACQSDTALREEIEKYKAALEKYFAKMNKSVVYFERNFRTQHLQLQCCPIPMEKADAVSGAFESKFSKYSIDATIIRDPNALIGDLVAPATPYFYAECPCSSEEDQESKVRFYSSRLDRKFPLNFGREVVAAPELLALPDSSIDWRNCALGKGEEIEAAAQFRDQFKPFDFNAEE